MDDLRATLLNLDLLAEKIILGIRTLAANGGGVHL
jgi:hypothetical protein